MVRPLNYHLHPYTHVHVHLGFCTMEPQKIDFSRDLDVGFYMFVDRAEVRKRSLFASSALQL